jgi:hypothetical protein
MEELKQALQNEAELLAYCQQNGINPEKFKSEMDDPKFADFFYLLNNNHFNF